MNSPTVRVTILKSSNMHNVFETTCSTHDWSPPSTTPQLKTFKTTGAETLSTTFKQALKKIGRTTEEGHGVKLPADKGAPTSHQPPAQKPHVKALRCLPMAMATSSGEGSRPIICHLLAAVAVPVVIPSSRGLPSASWEPLTLAEGPPSLCTASLQSIEAMLLPFYVTLWCNKV